ncbi:MAG: hypothetical protein O9340_14210 [Cyclobacteriaceae bacterium]|jgi:hypothetical protein|nr:hypothetical protein [Cyclobacteriaceae bacterium]
MKASTFKWISNTIAIIIIVLATLRVLHVVDNNAYLIIALVTFSSIQMYYISYLEKKQV